MSSGESLFAGFRVGVVIGAAIGFFQAKKIRRLVQQPELIDTVRDRFVSIRPTDTLTQSIAEGKAVARRHRAQSDFHDT